MFKNRTGGRIMRQMSMNSESLYWLTNKSWYRINREKDCFEILDSAPAKAKLSFEIWSGKRKTSKKKKSSFLRFFKI